MRQQILRRSSRRTASERRAVPVGFVFALGISRNSTQSSDSSAASSPREVSAIEAAA
jgi:hypothetical protein